MFFACKMDEHLWESTKGKLKGPTLCEVPFLRQMVKGYATGTLPSLPEKNMVRTFHLPPKSKTKLRE